jgi:hypothetical protein
LPSGVTINCTAPGPTPTDAPGWKEMVRATGTGVLYRLLGWLYGWRDVATGCQSMLVLMGSPVMTGVTGQILDFGYGTFASVCLPLSLSLPAAISPRRLEPRANSAR